MSNKNGRTLIIGFDGASYAMLDFWVKRGDMPNLKRLMSSGLTGDVESSMPPMTAPAWNSWATGCNPGKHNVYDFMSITRTPGRYSLVNFHSRQRRGLWEYFTEAGLVSTFQNMPTTFPPAHINGFMVSGMLTPANRRKFGRPRSLLREIEEKFGSYPLYYKSPMFILNLNEDLINSFIDETIQHLTYKFNVFNYLQERLHPAFSFIHEFGNDQISHALWHIIEPEMGEFDPELIKRLRIKVSSYYKLFDNYLGIIMERLKEEDSLIIMSDHGFGRWHKTIALNTWLLKNGFIALKNRWVTKLRHKLWQNGVTHAWIFKNIVKRLANWGFRAQQHPIGEEFYKMQSRKDFLLTVRDIDWSRTKAFSTTGWGQIFINSKEKFINGAVKNQTEYNQVFKDIVDALGKMEDPDSGPINGKIWDKHSLYNGPCLDIAPDITFSALDKGYLATNLYGFITNEPVGERWVFTGTHRQNGVFIGSGPGFRTGEGKIKMHLQDFLPNLLYLNHIPIPVDIDGKVKKEMFTERFLKAYEPEYKGSSKLKKKGLKKIFSRSEEEKIENTLKGLGYL